jgi:tellurite resistance protein TehA-like permease
MSTAARAVGDLDPAYFALVMATGIISVAAHQFGLRLVAEALLALNLTFYAVLWLLTLARLAFFPGRFFADLGDHARGAGYFTTSAGTCVLGSQLVVLRGSVGAATALWGLGAALWLAVTYAFFTAISVRHHKPTVEEGLSPTWLLSVVAAQSVAALGGLLAPAYPGGRDAILFLALAAWLVAGALYGWLITLIFYRCAFVRLTPAEVTPPYLVNMGAMAISTLAGCELVAEAATSPVLADLAPFLRGVTILYWATATFWVPLVLALVGWKYGYARAPLRYEPSDWGAVFPLGMDAASTTRLAEVLGLPFLRAVPHAFLVAALAAWVVALLGLLKSLFPSARGGQPAPPEVGAAAAGRSAASREDEGL